MSEKKTIIIGGGLSGLSLAYFLQEKKEPFVILEASTRLGGRIETITGVLGTPMELGATWFADKHSNLCSLIKSLDLKTFKQFSEGVTFFQTKSFEPPQLFFVPASEQPSYRLKGGTKTLIEALALRVGLENIKLNCKVDSIEATDGGVRVASSNGEVQDGHRAIICIPPALASRQITFTPALPLEIDALLPTVQTWMAGSIKFVMEFKKPFWREKGYSGMLYSHADIVVEMYDHVSADESKFAFTGFLNSGTMGFTSKVRQEIVANQLAGLLGEEAKDYISYQDKVWNDKLLIDRAQDIHSPHQNNGDSLLQRAYLDGRVLFSNTETASEYPGYMEGAVQAARRAADNKR